MEVTVERQWTVMQESMLHKPTEFTWEKGNLRYPSGIERTRDTRCDPRAARKNGGNTFALSFRFTPCTDSSTHVGSANEHQVR